MRTSIGTGITLIAAGGVLAFGVSPPAAVMRYVDVPAVGLILVWAGVLTLGAYAWWNRRPRPRGRTPVSAAPTETDEHDVHRPGYAGQTRRFPTVRGR